VLLYTISRGHGIYLVPNAATRRSEDVTTFFQLLNCEYFLSSAINVVALVPNDAAKLPMLMSMTVCVCSQDVKWELSRGIGFAREALGSGHIMPCSRLTERTSERRHASHRVVHAWSAGSPQVGFAVGSERNALGHFSVRSSLLDLLRLPVCSVPLPNDFRVNELGRV